MLKENKNIDHSYTDRVVRQLVDETEIDFKNSRVNLPSANFSFPFYSFGARRAYPENIISEPKSNFGKYVISNYGVDETEYKEIYSMYMGVIAGRLKDHDENVNHLHLHESSYTPKYYAPKWAVRRENDFLDRIVDGLVEESRIEYVEEIVHLADFSFQLFKAPFSYLQNIPETSPFYQHCMDVYGLTPEEIIYVWKEYRNIIRKEMQSNPLSNLHSPFNESINESREDNLLGTIVSQLVDETEIDYEYEIPHISAFPDTGFYIDSSFNLNLDLSENLFGNMFNSFWRHCRNVYGLTDPEIQKVWWPYKKEILKKIEAKRSLNESTEDNFLDKIVDQLVDESIIDYDTNAVYFSDFPVPFNPLNLIPLPAPSLFADPFYDHGREVYGLTPEEITYVWKKYKSIIIDKIKNKPLFALIDGRRLNESTEDNFLDKIVEQLLDETQVFNDRGQLRAKPPFFPNEWEDMETEGLATGIVGGISLAELIDSTDATIIFGEFKYYCKQMYGLTFDECYYVWREYRSGLYQTDFSHLYTPNVNLNESIEDSFLDKIVNQLVDETILKDDEYEIPVAYPSWITDDGATGQDGVSLDVLIDSDKNSVNFVEFRYYANNMYGLDEDEIDYVWDQYRSGVWDKEQNRINDYHRSLEDEDLNESKKDLNSYVHTVVGKMVDSTHLKYKKTTNTIWVKLPFHIMLNNKGKNIEEVSSTYITSPTARVVAEIRKHLILIYGMNKWETDQAAIMYLSKMTDKITDYKDKGFDDNWNELNESENKKEKHLDRVLDHLVSGTTIKKEIDRDPLIKVPYLPGNYRDSDDSGYYLSSHIFHSASSHYSFIDYGKEVYGLTEDEINYIAKKYIEILRYKIKHQPYKLDESKDNINTFTDDKDFPFLNKLANHTMKETEISRNAVMFPFIDGYISNNNFHRYFDGTSYDQLPFEATVESDQYLKQFGLTENEKEIWWDIYIVKVREAINQQDSNELNETTGDNVLDKIAYSMYKESISTPDSFPFDSTSMSFNDYVKNMYGISDEEADYVYREFRYLKGWSEPDPYLPDPLNEQTFVNDIDDPIYEKIADTLVRESEIVISPAPYNKMFLRSPAWREAPHIENVIDQLTGRIKDVVPDRFVKHLKEIYNIKYPTFVHKVWELYRDKMLERIKIRQAILRQTPPKQQKFFDHIVKTLVDETEIESTRHVHDEGRERIWVTPPFLTHGIDGGPRYQEGSVDWSDFSYFGYGYARYMKDIYGLTDKEGLKLWAVYYKALEKKVDELIERDRIIYGDD